MWVDSFRVDPFNWSNVIILLFRVIAEFKDDDMQLNNIKIPIFEDYIIRLVSIFLDWIELDNATGDIGHFMNQIYCTGLSISNMELDRANTKSLVQCLQYNVHSLELGRNGPVILDINTLLEYSGKGKCSQLSQAQDQSSVHCN